MQKRRCGLVMFAALAVAGCKEDGSAPVESDGGTESGEDDDSGSETEPNDDDGTATSGATDSASGTSVGTTAPEEDVPARGLTITRVDANPGVAIPLVVGGAWVEGPQRAAQIPQFRNTAFRVYVDVDESTWVLREIEGRLTIYQADGTEKEYRERAEIGIDSSETSLQSNILFGVLAEDMQPGAQFHIELYEAGGDYESLPAVDTPPSALPGPEFIGIEGSVQDMKIVIVPIAYDFGGCSTVFDTSEESIQKYDDAMFQQNGLETIQIAVHDPVPYSQDLTQGGGFFNLLNTIVSLRASESPDPNVYYYGIFDNCGTCIGDGGGCLLGVAPGQPGSSMGEASSRAAIGTQFLGSDEVGIETFVHEVGHTQGRAHVACPGGGAAGTDPSYPHAEGEIGVWGFGVRDFEVRNATTFHDYMSYCSPTWVSDWQWKATFERIRELSSWDAGDMGELDGQHVLVGAYNPETGESKWWTDRGWVVDERKDSRFAIDFLAEDGLLQRESAVEVNAWSEGPWLTIRAPLAEDFETLEFHAPAATLNVERKDVALYHANSLTTP